MSNYEHYTYRIIWPLEDKEYIGLSAEFPSLSFLDKKQAKALEGITDLVKQVIEDMEENGEKIPDPISERKFSGKLQLRIPPEQHRMLAMHASEENISLNRYIAHKLSA